MYYFINDVETSGRSRWHHDVISLGAVVKDEGLNIIDEFYEECRPWNIKTFDHETTDVHGFTLDYLMDKQSSYDMCISYLNFVDKYRDKSRIVYRPFIYHAQNRFDYLFVYNMFLKNGLEFSFRKVFNWRHSYSTIRMGRNSGYVENGLSVWADRICERFYHHNALSDAHMASKVFKFLISKGATLESGFEIRKDEIDTEAINKKSNKDNNKCQSAPILNFSQGWE